MILFKNYKIIKLKILYINYLLISCFFNFFISYHQWLLTHKLNSLNFQQKH